MNKLEAAAVQMFALRVISHQLDTIYEYLLSLVNIQKLQERRLKLKLTMAYKTAHCLCYFLINSIVLHESHSAKLKHITLLSIHRQRIRCESSLI